MPQLKVIGPQTNTQFPTSSPAQMDMGVGNATRELGQTVQGLGVALDSVAKFRAEEAATLADQELQKLQAAEASNPNRLLGDEWRESFDSKADAIREKFGQTPFIRSDTFERKFGVAQSARKMQLEGMSVDYKIKSAVAAMQTSMTALSSGVGAAKTSEERDFLLGQIDQKADQAVAEGLILEGQRAGMVLEAKTNGFIAAFNRINNDNPIAAMDFLQENKSNMTTTEYEKLRASAIASYSERLRLGWAQERNERANAKFFRSEGDRVTMQSLATKSITDGVTMDDLQAAAPRLTGEHINLWRRFLEDNPGGRTPGAKADDPGAVVSLEGYLRGKTTPLGEDGEPKPFSSVASEMVLSGLITTGSYKTYMKAFDAETSDPVVDMLSDTVEALVLNRPDEAGAALNALVDYREWRSGHPDAGLKESAEAAANIAESYNVFGIGGAIQSRHPDYFLFEGQEFQFEKSANELTKQFQAKKINESEYKLRLLGLDKFKQTIEARKRLRGGLGLSE